VGLSPAGGAAAQDRGPEAAQGGRPGDQDHAPDQRDDPGRLQREHRRRDADGVAEYHHTEQDADHRLGRGDRRERGVQRRGAERILHQPHGGQRGHRQAVGGPGGQYGSHAVVLDDQQGVPGQRVRNAKAQPGRQPGERGPLLAGAPQAGPDQDEGQEADRRGGGPVGGGPEAHALGVHRPRRGQRAHARAEQDGTQDFRLTQPFAAQRHRDHQGEYQLRGQQRFSH